MHLTTIPARRQKNYTRDALPPGFDALPRVNSRAEQPPLDMLDEGIAALEGCIAERADLSKVIRMFRAVYDYSETLWQTEQRKSMIEPTLRLKAIERNIAKIFGDSRGWQLGKAFRLSALFYGVEFDESALVDNIPPYCDHPLYYRDVDGLPVAIAAQEYRFDDDKRKECEQFAMMTGIKFDMPDIQSWHSNGTTLIVWKRK